MKILKNIFTFLLVLSTSIIHSQSYFPLSNTETNLASFSGVNGQWIAVTPTNNSLGSDYYQGINFGFDTNNYTSLVNGVGTDDLYFGRWSYEWKGWNKIWHSGNLNNMNADFNAKTLNSTGLNIEKSYHPNSVQALKIFYQGSWGTPQYASNYRFIDIESTEEGKIFSLNAYGMGIGYNPPSYASSDRLYINGNVGISTTTTGSHKLAVEGSIGAREIKVYATQWSDFVFKKEYTLPTLEEVEKQIAEKGHLANIPSEDEVLKNGINLGEMNSKLLQKIEELTLYMIEMKKENEAIKKENVEMKKNQIDFEKRLLKIENK